MMKWRRPFYGWWIVGAAIGAQALSAGLLQQAFGSYVVLLQREFGWNRTALSGAFSLARVEDGLLGPFQGWLLDRVGPRVVMRTGVLIFATGFFVFARIDSIPAFYGAYVLMAVGASLAGFLSITTVIVNWFERKRQTAMGIALLGTAIGGFSLPLVVYGLETLGWRTVATISGVIVLGVGLPLTQIIRQRPEQYGYLPDGRQPGEAVATSGDGSALKRVTPDVDFTVRQALRTRAFWFISLAHAASVLVVSVVQVHFTAHLVESLGYSLSLAATMTTIMTAANFLGRPFGGWVANRTGSRLVILACMLLHASALLALAYSTAGWVIAASAIANGLAWGARVPVVVTMRAEYFGAKSFGAIMGLSSSVVTVASVSAPLLAGASYDMTGSYRFGFTALAVAALGSLFVVFLPKPSEALPEPGAGSGTSGYRCWPGRPRLEGKRSDLERLVPLSPQPQRLSARGFAGAPEGRRACAPTRRPVVEGARFASTDVTRAYALRQAQGERVPTTVSTGGT
ncbi:MAG: MFS transporter [Dehalococcoidia bacterium]